MCLGYSGWDQKALLYTHTHTRLTALFPGLPGWASTRKVKPIWIFQKQDTVSGSGISWAICKSATRSRQITMPAPHHSVFLQAGCPSCRPTNSIKALKPYFTLTILRNVDAMSIAPNACIKNVKKHLVLALCSSLLGKL